MRLSKALFATLREEPADADVRSHALFQRAGFVHKLAPGIYVYGPMLWRTLRRVSAIVREEHDAVGAIELHMPALQPKELWVESGRWERYVRDGILFHFRDRKAAEVCLGPTHEEVVTDVVRRAVQSYKQLPLTLYQIQTKFRDEIRPRFGLMRGREFMMKDAYSFDVDADGMARSYDVMKQVYRAIFTRCGLGFTPVEADSGSIGGARSEEFMVDAASGEDAIAICRERGYAANLEKATSAIPAPPAPPAKVAMHVEATPRARSCDDLRAFFPELPLERMLKTVIYRVTFASGSSLASKEGKEAKGSNQDKKNEGPREQVVAVMCRGDREINEIKLANYLGALEVEMADEKLVREATGAEPGFAGPIGLKPHVRLLADRSVNGVEGFLCGGNQTDVHYLDVWFGRDLEQPETADFGTAQAGDRMADGDGVLEIVRGIEVGHVFQLGTKYSETMAARYLDPNGKSQVLWMGCYGIGVSRVAAAAIEQNHDAAGMIWPLPIAPHSVILITVKSGDPAQDELAESLYDQLRAAGVDVVFDDRPKVSPGVKFKDADLIGIPIRITIGRDAGNGVVEWSLRRTAEQKESLAASEAVSRAIAMVAAAKVPAV
jgi:prolyl-tRNA synthetase